MPELRVGLNQDLNIGRDSGAVSYGITVDDCNFHECVQLDEFERDRTLVLKPPDGEFTLMRYRIAGQTDQARSCLFVHASDCCRRGHCCLYFSSVAFPGRVLITCVGIGVC